jgi:polar amino acid transport system substrate-binding protein
VLLVREDDADFYSSTASFAGAKIGAVSTSMAMEILVNSMPEAIPTPFSGSGDVVTALATGAVDAAIVRRDTAESYYETFPGLVVFAVPPGQSGNMCIAVAKDDPNGLLPGINEAIADMIKNDKVNEFVAAADALADVAQEVTAE